MLSRINLSLLTDFFSLILQNDRNTLFKCITMIMMALLKTVTTITGSFFLKLLVNAIESKQEYQEILMFLLYYCLIWLFGSLLISIQEVGLYKTIERSVRAISAKFISHITTLPIEYHANKNTGAFIDALGKVRPSLYSIFHGFFIVFLPTLLGLIISASVFFKMYNVKFSFVIVFGLLGSIIYGYYSSKQILYLKRKVNIFDKDSPKKLLDILQNFETIRYFGTMKYEGELYSNILEKKEKHEISNIRKLTSFNIGIDLILFLSFFTLNFFLINEILLEGNVGDFVFVSSLMLQIITPLRSFGSVFMSFKKALVDLEFILKILSSKTMREDLEKKVAIKKWTVEFQNVTFDYENKNKILQGINFNVCAGKILSIVGETGSGKSTISKLIFGFYKPSFGEILIGGYDINIIPRDVISHIIGIVPQDPVIFNNSLEYNICYGTFDATTDDMVKAVKKAQLENFINSLPSGYKTMVGERGIKLSGGEKQRIALARIFLKNPKILIFDEATSSLDTKTEEAIKNVIIKEAKFNDKAVIVISHNLLSIKDSDQILVLKNGKICETGRHKELIKRNGIYKSLWAGGVT